MANTYGQRNRHTHPTWTDGVLEIALLLACALVFVWALRLICGG